MKTFNNIFDALDKVMKAVVLILFAGMVMGFASCSSDDEDEADAEESPITALAAAIENGATLETRSGITYDGDTLFIPKHLTKLSYAADLKMHISPDTLYSLAASLMETHRINLHADPRTQGIAPIARDTIQLKPFSSRGKDEAGNPSNRIHLEDDKIIVYIQLDETVHHKTGGYGASFSIQLSEIYEATLR